MSATISTAPSGSSYTEKLINITITLGTGTFGQTGKNTVKLSGLRVLATIQKGGFPSMDRASIRVYGVQPSIMNAVSTLGIPLSMIRIGNSVTVEAGDTVNGMAVVYSGYMHQCWQDFSESPETALVIGAYGGMSQAVQPVAPSSFQGTADVATIMSDLATQMGMAFENSGVQVKLSNPYFPGTALQQAHDVARAANIEMYVDTSSATGTLAIWPKTGTRGGQIPLINAASGLIGYPKYQSNGMSFRSLYNPNIKLGAQIQMQSSLSFGAAPTVSGSAAPAAQQTGGPNGIWYVVGDPPMVHTLSSQLPGGPWFTDVGCVRVPGTPGSA